MPVVTNSSRMSREDRAVRAEHPDVFPKAGVGFGRCSRPRSDRRPERSIRYLNLACHLVGAPDSVLDIDRSKRVANKMDTR